MQAEIYNLEKAEWTIDKASDQRMVYVPKDTVIEFMKKVSESFIQINFEQFGLCPMKSNQLDVFLLVGVI